MAYASRPVPRRAPCTVRGPAPAWFYQDRPGPPFTATLVIYEVAIRRYQLTRLLFGMKPPAPHERDDGRSRRVRRKGAAVDRRNPLGPAADQHGLASIGIQTRGPILCAHADQDRQVRFPS